MTLVGCGPSPAASGEPGFGINTGAARALFSVSLGAPGGRAVGEPALLPWVPPGDEEAADIVAPNPFKAASGSQPWARAAEDVPGVVDDPRPARTVDAASAEDDRKPGRHEPVESGSSPEHDESAYTAGPGEEHFTYSPSRGWRGEYLELTEDVVLANDGEIDSSVAYVTGMLADGDADGLAASFAPDEGAGDDVARAMAASYPSILEYSPTNTVAVYAFGDATVYFGFALVNWEDAGVVSQHTIAIPLRYIDGVWYLSTIGLGTPGLQYVQSLQI